MINTYTSYQLIARDLGKALSRVEDQPTVERETEYYLKNITKVKSVDEFVKNDRLFKYAMKAHGLENMSYAKAFIAKALKEGVANKDSFANKLSDKRYAEFVKSFNFAELGDKATVFNKAQQGAVDKYLAQVKLGGGNPNSPAVQQEVQYYLDNIVKVKSAKDLMSDTRLYAFAMKSFAIEASIPNKEMMEKVLAGGVRDPKSFANQMTDKRYAAFASTYNFEAFGESATTYNPAQKPAVDKYVRQTLEENAGKSNEGVRLALYFERKAKKSSPTPPSPRSCARHSACLNPLPLPTSTSRSSCSRANSRSRPFQIPRSSATSSSASPVCGKSTTLPPRYSSQSACSSAIHHPMASQPTCCLPCIR